ncbi:hypothetical protein QQS45_03605 [Alteriqipengyuania flavescens]|uniref:hypothetical protein n=1 Tax=Alteriqipengyuania flavescens TaxID=3053610 RepID=UPI0025B53A65|nr:hypothetical protein [Alteriqipengyuania flavescens]WJY19330.1 hypothetical protein QQW98_03600 [Alteriqipengyuania flavescens]WJY25271.1 hypothetical protein QQS45_03605 [Alteriqipengyuania flavescens]
MAGVDAQRLDIEPVGLARLLVEIGDARLAFFLQHDPEELGFGELVRRAGAIERKLVGHGGPLPIRLN